MLVLQRKVDQSIDIGDGIVVTVVSIRNGAVRIGISAPDDVDVWRSELVRDVTPVGQS